MSGRWLRIAIASLVALAGSLASAQTSESSSGQYDGFQLFVENDKFNLFRRSDQWYTNGVRLVLLPRCAPTGLLRRYAEWVGSEFGEGRPARFGAGALSLSIALV